VTVLHTSIHDISRQPVTTGGIGQHVIQLSQSIKESQDMLISKKNSSVSVAHVQMPIMKK
jgi:hypothetical protein